MAAFPLTASKNLEVGLLLEVHEQIWFILGVVIDITGLYIFRLVSVTLTFIQDHREARKQKKLSSDYLLKF